MQRGRWWGGGGDGGSLGGKPRYRGVDGERKGMRRGDQKDIELLQKGPGVRGGMDGE